MTDNASPSADTASAGPADTAEKPDSAPWTAQIEDEAVRSFVGDKSPAEIAAEAYRHRQAASRREEQILEDGNYLRPPKAGEELEFFRQFAPEDPTAYAAVDPESFGESASAYSRDFMEAAKESGVSVQQFEALVTRLRAGDSARAEAAGQQTQSLLREQWGQEYDAKAELVNRAAKTLFDDGGEAFLRALTVGAAPKDQARALEQLAQIGVSLGDGLPASVNTGASTQTQEQELAQLKAAAVAAGGVTNLPAEKQARYNAILYGEK